MAFNLSDCARVDLRVFGSLCTEPPPDTLPAGVSPDNQDVIHLPGGVGSRAALNRVFATPFPAPAGGVVPTGVSGKSFVQPNGDIINLFLDSNGYIWEEDFTNAPGTYTELATTTPGSYFKSCTAFGREYIAISDGLHGQEVPLQYDGTNLDRVTQDGPGACATVASVPLPSVDIAAGAPLASLVVTEADPTTDVPPFTFYTGITFWTPSSVVGVQVGMQVTIAGNSSSAMNVTATIVSISTGGSIPGYQTAIYMAYYNPPGTASGLGGTATITGAAVTRANNLVTVSTATAHQLQVGYQALVANLPATPIGSGPGNISGIVIDNEDLPGLATVTVTLASGQQSHGLAPGDSVFMNGIPPTTIDTGSTAARAGGVTAITTSTLVTLAPGTVVTTSGFSDASFDTTIAIQSVTSTATTTTFTFLQTDTDSTATGGTVKVNWPIPDTPTPAYFEVESCPTNTTFQVQLNYSDGTWGAGGTVSFGWNGTYFVLTVPSATSFTYQQYGPDAQAALPSDPPLAIVTPWGQAAPGLHQMQVSFLTRNGAITRPSPPTTFMANGGQYLSIANIPIGPPNVVARILEFTGAGGAYFFYIPDPPLVNGQQVAQPTQINDNTTISALFDFSDNTLFASLATSIPGNDLASQIVLDSALGFGLFDSRLIAWGQRNVVQNFLNMTFDGGYLPSQATYGFGLQPFPSGWQFHQNPGGAPPPMALTAGRFNATALEIHVQPGYSGNIYQGAYRDAYGVPILLPNTLYKYRVYIQPSAIAADVLFTIQISSALTGFITEGSVAGTSMNANGSWVESNIGAAMPASIPPDLIMTILATSSGSSITLTISDLSIIYQEQPYLETTLYGSYVNNPEGFDGVTGVFGPADDSHKVMDFGIIRSTMYIGTREPSGRVHEVFDNGVTEPSGWSVNQVAANCGLLSAFCLTKSQADDQAAGGGEEWLAWASTTGGMIFAGGRPMKISQEIQPDWAGGSNGQLTFPGINPAAYTTVWAVNDYVNRIIYFGLPLGTAATPNLVYPLNYRELDSAESIAAASPFHPSFSGHLIATDNTRKWTRWNMTMNGGAMMYRTAGGTDLSVVMFGGNAQPLGDVAGFGNAYILNFGLLTDDDYGAILPYYVTYFFVNRQDEAMMKTDRGVPIGFGRKLLAYQTTTIAGVGTLTITAFANTLLNPWPLNCVRQLAKNPTFDTEWGGGMCTAQRIALKFASSAAL